MSEAGPTRSGPAGRSARRRREADAAREVRSGAHRAFDRAPTLLLALSMFSTGACGLIAEYILATVSTYVLGNSIEQWSVVIGLMLAMMGLASWVQKFVSDSRLIEKFLAVEVLLAVLTSGAPLAIYGAYAAVSDHFALVQYAFVISIGFLIGFEIPLILRINERYAKRLRINVASILSADYIGGLVGAIIWAFVLLRLFPLSEIGVLVAFVNFTIAAATYAYLRRLGQTRRSVWPLVATGLVLGWLALLFTQNQSWAASLEQRLYDDPIVLRTTTRYQHIVLTHNRALDEYRLYLNGNTQFASSDERIYHEQLVHPAMALTDRRARVLILGGGDGLALREVLKYSGVRRVNLVDLDPAMTRLAATHPVLVELNDSAFRDARVAALEPQGVSPAGVRDLYRETGRYTAGGRPATEKVATVRVMNVDALRFLRAVPEENDVIVIDLPDPNAIELAKLYSREFYRGVRERLAPGGVVVVQATSPYHAREPFLCIRRTLESAGFHTLPFHDNVPSFGEWGWIIGWRPDAPPTDPQRRITVLERFPVETRYLTADVFRAATVFPKGWLEARTAEVNTLLDPVLLDLYLRESWKLE